LIREDIARRLTLEIDHDTETVAKLLALAVKDPKLTGDILRGIAAAVDGRKNLPVPANWSDVSAELATGDGGKTSDSLNVIGVAFNDGQIIASLRRTAEDTLSKPEKRSRALHLLVTSHAKGLNDELRRLVKDPDLALEAIRGLAFYDDPKIPATVLDNYDRLTPTQRAAAINTLASRVNYARVLVHALESKRLPLTDMSAFQARQVMALGNASLSDRLRAVWGDVRQTSAEKHKMIENLRQTLTPKIAEADLENGKAIFTRTCANCHVLFGQGAKIGPELTGSNRKNLDYLLENMIDPSAVVAAEFRVSVFTLSDGRVLSGIVREQNEKTITVQTPELKQIIDRRDVEETTVSDKSLMPDGQLQVLSDSQIRDLIGYLMSN
jgi:putative heme-binding domain-containing protein